MGWISKPWGSEPRTLRTVRRRPHMAAASTGGGSTAARRAIRASGPASPSRCISAFFSAQSLSSSLARHRAQAHELLAVELADGGVALDLRVHEGLGVAGLVPLVVAPAPVADEVDDHVLLEALAVLEGEPRHVDHGLGVVGVHVEGGSVDHLGHVGAVGRAARVLGQRGEADLVVHHDMDRPSGVVPGEAGEVQGLRHDPLPGERRVAVHEDGDHARAVGGRRARPAGPAPSPPPPGPRTPGGSGWGRG